MTRKRNIRRRRATKINIRGRKRMRRNQRGGLLPLPLLALGTGLLTPILAHGIRDLIKKLNI